MSTTREPPQYYTTPQLITWPEESKNLSTYSRIWSNRMGNMAGLSSCPTSSLTCFCMCVPKRSLLQTRSFSRWPINLGRVNLGDKVSGTAAV